MTTTHDTTPANTADKLDDQTAGKPADLIQRRMLPDVPQITFTVSAITLQTIAANARIIVKNAREHLQYLRLDINPDGSATTTTTDSYRALCETLSVNLDGEPLAHTVTVYLALPLLEQIAARKIPKADHQRPVTVAISDHLTTITWPRCRTAAITATPDAMPHRDTFWPQQDDKTGPEGRTAARHSVWNPHLLADLAKLRHWNNGAKFERATLRIDAGTKTTADSLKPGEREQANETIRGAAVWTLQCGPGDDDTVQVALMPMYTRVR